MQIIKVIYGIITSLKLNSKQKGLEFMAFCKFSNDYIISSSTNVDNIFINDYLPFCDDKAAKVYLFGLYKCSDSASFDNTLESFANNLKMSEDDVIGAFKYWENEGLVQLINVSPLEVRYLPIRSALTNIKKYNKNKYSAFNRQIQEIIEGRMISPNEYANYYDIIENYHMESDALIMIAKYCTNLKGKSLGYAYITTIAKNWAREGILTAMQVEEKLKDQERSYGKLKEVLTALKISRDATIEERQEFVKWQKEFGFSYETIIFVAKLLKGKGGVTRLDGNLTKYNNLNLKTEKEIEEYEKNKENIFEITKQIVKTLGLYYESLESIVETYTNPWLAMGFSEKMLLNVASICLRQNIRTLEGMNTKLNQFYKLGILTNEHLTQYANEICKTDEEIRKVLDACGISRLVNNFDRSMFRTWTYTWGFTLDVILFACELAKNMASPMQYASKILSNWKNAGITTLEQAKNEKTFVPSSERNDSSKNDFHQKEYSKQELDALFDNLDEVLGDDKKWNN